MEKENLTKRQKEIMKRAQRIPVQHRDLRQLYEAQGIVAYTPAEQCEAAGRFNKKHFGRDD